MSITEIPVRLPTDMLNALRTLASGEEMKVNDFIRSIVAQEVLRHTDLPSSTLQSGDALAALRVQLGKLLSEAEDLDELNWDLKERGYVLRQDGDNYLLCTWPVLKPICTASDLGLSQSRLQSLDPEPDAGKLAPWALTQALNFGQAKKRSA